MREYKELMFSEIEKKMKMLILAFEANIHGNQYIQLFFLLQIVRAHISIMHSAFIDLFAEGISIKYFLIALFGKLGLLLLDRRIFWLKLVIYRFWSYTIQFIQQNWDY